MPSATTVACPYCNAFVPVPGDAAAGRRLTCPRCGDGFAYLARDGGAAPPTEPLTAPFPHAITAAAPATEGVATDTFRGNARLLLRILLVMGVVLLIVGGAYVNSIVANGLKLDVTTFASVAVPLVVLWVAVGGGAFLWLWFFRVRRSNGASALFILGNMVTVAVLALGGALATQSYRRHIDHGLPARPKRSPVVEEVVTSAVAPGRLAALAYLPPGTDLLAGVHGAELLADPAGKKILSDPLKVGNTELRLGDLTGKVGLNLTNVDHFVVGMRTEEILSATFVFRTLAPYDALKVREVLNARTLPGTPKDRTLYQVTLPVGTLSGFLWCADEHTLLISLARNSLEKAALPHDGAPDPLVPDLRAVLSERIRPVAQLWTAGHSPNWAATSAVLLLAQLPPEWQDRLVTVRTFGVWAVLADKTVTVNAAARCDDEKAVERLEKWLVSRANPKNPPAVATDGNWLSLQRQADADAFRGMLAPDR